MNTTTFLLLRLAVGLSFLGHGLVRLPKLNAFSNWMVGSFQNSMLPTAIVAPFSYALPIAEFVVGLLLVFGLYTKTALVAGGAVMLLLILGTTLIENWEALPSQMIHMVFVTILIQFLSSNSISVDSILINKK